MATRVRPAVPGDLPAITAIYAHHVRTGIASFEEIPPDAAEMARRHAEIVGGGFPYVVAEVDGAVAGYAYASLYRARSAYRFAVEDSVYVADGRHGLGLGRALLTRVIDDATALGKRQMVAVIGDSGNAASIGLHRACGFAMIGTLPAIGFKFGRWVDSVFMQRALGPGDATLPG
jgi:phosphinothricin acetyltransferase